MALLRYQTTVSSEMVRMELVQYNILGQLKISVFGTAAIVSNVLACNGNGKNESLSPANQVTVTPTVPVLTHAGCSCGCFCFWAGAEPGPVGRPVPSLQAGTEDQGTGCG